MSKIQVSDLVDLGKGSGINIFRRLLNEHDWHWENTDLLQHVHFSGEEISPERQSE